MPTSAFPHEGLCNADILERVAIWLSPIAVRELRQNRRWIPSSRLPGLAEVPSHLRQHRQIGPVPVEEHLIEVDLKVRMPPDRRQSEALSQACQREPSVLRGISIGFSVSSATRP